MEIPINLQLNKIRVSITPTTRPIGSIVAFVVVEFLDPKENIVFVIRGYTIRVKLFKNTSSPVFIVNAPAYKSGFQYKTSFAIDQKPLWKELSEKILVEFANQTGGKTAEDYISESPETINPEDIPL